MTSDPDGPRADEDPACAGLEPGVGDFVASLRDFAAGDAPAPPLELEAVFAGVLPAFPEPARRRVRLRVPLTAATLGALLLTVGLGMTDRLPGPARGMVSALESGLRPLHLVGPAGDPLSRPSPRPRTLAPARSAGPTHDLPLPAASATASRVHIQQDLRPSQVRTVATVRTRPVTPSRPAHAPGAGRPAHPAHPAHPRAAGPKAQPAHRGRSRVRHVARAPQAAQHRPGGWRRFGPQPPR